MNQPTNTTFLNGRGATLELANDRGLDGERQQSLALLDGGEAAYPRMLLSIVQARRFVHLEVYAFTSVGIGERFIETLGQAAKRGVEVQVVIDGWGSARGGHAVAEALRRLGCSVLIYSRLLALLVGHFGRNHRKLLLVDDQVAFIGGINIGDENLAVGTSLGWADLALEIRGRHCARLGEMIRDEPRRLVDGALRIHLSRLGGGWRLRRRYLKAFAGAKRSIHLAHGYFLPDPGVVRAITAAARRGVQVRLLLAGRSDVPFTRAATRSLYRRLFAAGVEIHEWGDSVLHAKVATVDSRCLLVGSFNLDPFSLANQEVLVEVADILVVGQGEKWIAAHFAHARCITAMEAASRYQRWIVDPFGRVLARIADKISRAIVGRRRRRYAKSQTQGHVASVRRARKLLVGLAGASVLCFGVVLIVLPGPGSLVIPLGLAILATEFLWARQLLQWLKTRAGIKPKS